jgi:hypothetical protein
MDTDQGYHVHYPPVLADIGSYVQLECKLVDKIKKCHKIKQFGKTGVYHGIRTDKIE